MWAQGWRETVWSQLDRDWDIVVVGGGITGAGILREAVRLGLRAVLFEAGDFASGTSSRSSKLVHGGLRYLKNAQVKLTSESVHERERLLREGRGLVSPLPFLMANFAGDRIPAWVFGVGLTLYDLLALKWSHRFYTPRGLRQLCPQLTSPGMLSGYRYFDAEVDDARLVLRVLLEAVQDGGLALNYARVEGLFQSGGQVRGVKLRDLAPGAAGRTAEVRAGVVINATGAWADELRSRIGMTGRLRKLRGSHLVFPYEKLPLTRAVTFLHPRDGRPVFVIPWEGVTFIGTSDVDHDLELQTDVRISAEEVEYFLDALAFAFPDLGLGAQDMIATYSGVRAVVDTGKADPSKESREYVLWSENGLLTVSGGKLTTFRLMAHSALRQARRLLPRHTRPQREMRVLDVLPTDLTFCEDLEASQRLRIMGRYGNQACNLVAAAQTGELEAIPPLPALWAELRWAARSEGVVHLDDLLLRRLRLGLLLPNGGLDYIDRIRAIAQGELGWDDARWSEEVDRYRQIWESFYSPP
jgi:glycerol-3-phosphate dehydrogenase